MNDPSQSPNQSESRVLPETTSSSLIERVKLRDEAAWERLVQLYGPLVYNWCRYAGVQPDDAADIAQDVFRAVLSGIEQFRRARPGDSFRGWLWTITRNKIYDHFRRHARHPQAAGGTDAQQQLNQLPELPEDLSEATSPFSQLSRDGLLQRALEILQTEFERSTWQAFWRTAIDGNSAAEVAGELGLSKGAVRQAKYRVLRRLRQEFE